MTMNEQINDGGITPRDYFAAKAMQGYLSHEAGANAECRTLAGWAYEMADAMLAARDPVTADIDAALATASQVMEDATPSWGRESADADGWIEWAGGDCPVPADTVVDVRFRNGEESCARFPDWWDWQHDPHPWDIVAYRVVRAGGAE